jgi:hypothetical protein
LVFYIEMYVPSAIAVIYDGDDSGFYGDMEGVPAVAKAGVGARVLPLIDILKAGNAVWPGVLPERIVVRNPGDENAQVSLHHSGEHTVLRNVSETLYLSASTGEVLRNMSAAEAAPRAVRSAMFGLHEGIFAGPWARWLYFGSGLLGCGMIATGLILWTVKRRDALTSGGVSTFGFRLVECLNVGSIVGLPAGMAAYFWANRLIPASMPGRGQCEFHALFAVWGLMLLYPAFRAARKAWGEELWCAAVLFAALPFLNALTGQNNLVHTLMVRDWALAGFDLVTFALGLALAYAARTMTRRGRAA